MASRSLNDLKPEAQSRASVFLLSASSEGFDVLLYCTDRGLGEQARLYRAGRSLAQIEAKAFELTTDWGRSDLADLLMDVGPQYGKDILTYAGPGQSLHNYALAIDACPLYLGKPVWSPKDIEHTEEINEAELWGRYGELARDADFEWAGDWSPGKREFPHMQVPNADWRDLIRSAA